MQKIEFKNLPDTSTPLNAENLNAIQNNIEETINTIEQNINNKLDKLIEYRESETDTGKVLNGKTIYRRTITGTITNPSSPSQVNTKVLLTGIEELVSVAGLYSPNSLTPNRWIGMPDLGLSETPDAYSTVMLSSGEIRYRVKSSAYTGQTGSYKITLEYTKTN